MCSVPPACSIAPGAQNESLGCPSLLQTGPNWTNNVPCGVTLDHAMVKADNLGTTFSQNAWAAAQQEGCLGCPNRYPTWPEPAVRGRLDIPLQAVVGMDPNFAVNDSPYLQPVSFYPDNYPGTPNNPMNVPGNNPPVAMHLNKILPHWPEVLGSTSPGSAMGSAAGSAMGSTAGSPVVSPVVSSTKAPSSYAPEALGPIQQHHSGSAHHQEHHRDDYGNPFLLFFEHIGNTIRGIFYDFSHWSSNHPDVPSGFWSHLNWVLFRDNRLKNLIYLLLLSLAISFLVWYVVRPSPAKNSPNKVSQVPQVPQKSNLRYSSETFPKFPYPEV